MKPRDLTDRPIARRAFVGSALAGSAGCLIARCIPALRAQGSDSRLEILPDEPIGTIAPELHGHFIEHLGGVIYDGVWVGEQSKIPNAGGIRQQLIAELRKITPPVIRWPGGCFATEGSRFWGLEESTCGKVLARLLAAGFLARSADERYRQA